MLHSDGSASVFVDRDLVGPDTIVDEERIVGRDQQLESVVSYLRAALEGTDRRICSRTGSPGRGSH